MTICDETKFEWKFDLAFFVTEKTFNSVKKVEF